MEVDYLINFILNMNQTTLIEILFFIINSKGMHKESISQTFKSIIFW